MKELNENFSYYFSIIACNSGQEQKFCDNAINQLLSRKVQKLI